MSWALAVLAGGLCGLLSGLGVGGGTLLLLCLGAFFGFDQLAAQGINLLYFLPTALAATLQHRKQGLVDKQVVLPATLAGLATALPAALAATFLDTALLHKLFSILLLLVGLKELLHKKAEK